MLLLSVMMVQANALQSALTKARQLQLSQSRYWHLLLHMPNNVSEIDDPAFFLAPDGKHNASAELNATLKALYHETVLDDNATGCRFPARRFWLRKTLQLQGLPELHCKAYNTLVKKMDPQSVTLVFSSAHINSPASMFGHTFLRIDSSFHSKMLSYAVNYAAGSDPDKENGVVFAIKGLTGGYPGFFSMLPYYEKLKEYRDSEQRDIWEYDLHFSHAQVMAMVRHIWELKDVYSWYYFFDENCSYNLLWLMEIADPKVELRDYFTYFVIPMETVHAAEQEHLVDKKHYRPSKRTVLLAYEAALDTQGKREVLSLAKGTLRPDSLLKEQNRSVQMKRYCLEAASELTQYYLMKGRIDRSDYLARYHAILSARASLGEGEHIEIKRPANPDKGHRATRVSAGTGWRNGLPVQMLGIRPAYHDLTDSSIGYMPGTQIAFLDMLLRHDKDGLSVEKATILSIKSIAQISTFFTPFSWQMHLGWDQSFYVNRATFSGGVGAGYAFGGDWGYAYFMLRPEFYIPKEVVGALEPMAGIVLFEGFGSKLAAEGGYVYYTSGRRQYRGDFRETLRLSKNSALKLSYDYTGKDVGVQRTFMIDYNYYF